MSLITAETEIRKQEKVFPQVFSELVKQYSVEKEKKSQTNSDKAVWLRAIVAEPCLCFLRLCVGHSPFRSLETLALVFSFVSVPCLVV